MRDTVAVLVVSDADPETRSRSILTLFDPWWALALMRRESEIYTHDKARAQEREELKRCGAYVLSPNAAMKLCCARRRPEAFGSGK